MHDKRLVAVLIAVAIFIALLAIIAGAARTQKAGAVVIDIITPANLTYELTETNASQTDFNLTYTSSGSQLVYFELPKNATINNATLTAIGYPVDKWNVSNIETDPNYERGTLVVDNNRRVHICYHDKTNGYLKYAYRDFGDPIDSWTKTTIDNDVGTVNLHCTIAVDSNNYPRIFYHGTSGSNDLRYAYYDGSWHTEVVNNSVTCDDIGMIIDKNDKTNIVFTIRNLETIVYGIRDGSWTFTNIESARNVNSCSIDMVAIDIDNSNRPHIIWGNGTTASAHIIYLKHAFKDVSWNKELIDYDPSYDFGDTDIDINNNDNIYLIANSYSDIFYYSKPNESSWTKESFPQSSNFGCSIKFNDIDNYTYTLLSRFDFDNYNKTYEIYRMMDNTNWSLWYQDYQIITSYEDDFDKDKMIFDYEGKVYLLFDYSPLRSMNLTYIHPYYIMNLTADTGNDGYNDFSQTGKYNSSNSINLNKTAISNFLSGCSSDIYGNCNITLIFNFYPVTFGLLQIRDINITYSYKLSDLFSYSEAMHNYGSNPIYVDQQYYNSRFATATSNNASQAIQIQGFNVSNYTTSCLINGIEYGIVASSPYRYCNYNSILAKGGKFNFSITENTTHVKQLMIGLACPTGYTDQDAYCERHIELASTTENYYIFKLNSTANYAKDYNITFNISKSVLDNWNDGSSRQILVGGLSTGVSYSDLSDKVQIIINTSHSTSSLSEGIHTVEIFYVTPGGAPEQPGGGGGGAPSAPREIVCGDSVCEYPETANNCPQDCTAPFNLDVSDFNYPAQPGSKIICIGSTKGCDIVVENPTEKVLEVKVIIEKRNDDSYKWAYLYKDDVKTSTMNIEVAPESSKVVTVGVDIPEEAEIGSEYSFHIIFESKGQKVFLPYNIQVVESLGITSQIFSFLFSNIGFGRFAIPGWAIITLILFSAIILLAIFGGRKK